MKKQISVTEKIKQQENLMSLHNVRDVMLHHHQQILQTDRTWIREQNKLC